MEFNEKDVKYDYYNPDDRRNGWMLDPNIGVHLTHVPTGLEARCGAHPAKSENKISAMYQLKRAVEAVHGQILVPKRDFDLAQIEYDFKNGVVLCRATIGKLIEYAKTKHKEK